MEGPINRDDINKPKDKLNYPWNTDVDFTEHDRTILKNEFLRSFDEQQVVQGFLDAKQVPYEHHDGNTLLETYRQQIGDFVYRALVLKKSGEVRDLFIELSRDLAQKPDSQLIFRRLDNSSVGVGYNLAHRLVRTGEEGIGGSSFLKKAEEYLKILKENKLIQCEWVGVDSRQPNVAEFFNKNEYQFIAGTQEVYEAYLQNKDAYEMVQLDFFDDTTGREPAPVDKQAFEDPEFMKYLVQENGVKTLRIPFDQLGRFDHYFVYTILVKDM